MLGIGQVDLKMTYGKVLTLKEVQHVLEVRRNLVSASSLVQQGHKVVITKNNVFNVCDSNWPPIRVRNKYFLTFIDDHSKYCYVYLIKTKDEVFEKFKLYKSEVENKLKRKVKILRSDRGREYTRTNLTTFCEKNGIIHEVTPPYSP